MAAETNTSQSATRGPLKRALRFIGMTVNDFIMDDCPRKAASLSFYTILSLPPLLLLILILLGQVVERELVQGQLQQQLRLVFGPQASKQILAVLKFTQRPDTGGLFTTILGVLAFLFGATNAFAQLQRALNDVWNVKPNPERNPVKVFLLKRLFSFGMLIVAAFLLLVSLALSALLSAFGDWLTDSAPQGLGQGMMVILSLVINYGVIVFIFAMVFKVLPDVRTKWKHVWLGAAVTTLLFILGKWAIGAYIGSSDPGNAYGAAGSLIVVLVWIYLTSMLLLLGAEFTKNWSTRKGRIIEPARAAVRFERVVIDNPDGDDESKERKTESSPVGKSRSQNSESAQDGSP